jgi:hypothetical protein
MIPNEVLLNAFVCGAGMGIELESEGIAVIRVTKENVWRWENRLPV